MSTYRYSQVALDEVELLQACHKQRENLAKAGNSPVNGGDFIVQLSGYFEHKGVTGSQVCMELEMLGPSLLDLVKDYSYKGVPVPVVKAITRNVLTGLDFLHRQCGIIHTDVKPENILLSLPSSELQPDEGFWGARKAKKGDADTPMWWRKHSKKSPTGLTLNLGWSKELFSGGCGFEPRAKLVDLGNACLVDKPFTADIQTIEYRCPEVILGSGEIIVCPVFRLSFFKLIRSVCFA